MGGEKAFRAMSERVRLEIWVSAVTVVRARWLLGELNMTREAVAGEALRDWTLRREAALSRDRRARLAAQIRRFADTPGLGGLQEGMQQGLGVDSRPGGVVGSRQMPGVLAPAIRERRAALGLSQQALAEAAKCSIQALRAYEGGLIPRRSDVLPRIENALAEAENAAR